jgi:hypothetical protein
MVAGCVEACLLMAMSHHDCRPCGSTPAHRDVSSRLQAIGKPACPHFMSGVCTRGSRGGAGPSRDLCSTPKSGSNSQGSSEVESSPRSKEARPVPEGLGEAERLPRGSDEPRTSLVGPNWAVATLTIILGGLRPMSFDSCLMGIVILIPNR